jgi:hypothetical protein
MVELFAVIVEKVDEVLTCQLYAMIPLGSVTADQEIVNGAVTLAPETGESRPGAAGPAAVAMFGMNRKKQKAKINPKQREECCFMDVSVFVQGDGSSARGE